MLNPFDGALFASGGAAAFLLAVATGSAVPAAVVTGVFMVIVKCLELWWKGRRDKRVRDLEQQVQELKKTQRLVDYE